MKATRAAAITITALVVLALAWFILKQSVDTYDSRFTSCMEIEKSRWPHYVIPFPSQDWDRAAKYCNERAISDE